jgi:predicted dehydrogenase
MQSWKRKLRMGMVGGGKGAFIGAVHRLAAEMDHQAEIVAGCFSRDPENTRQTGKAFYLDPRRCYRTYQEMAEKEAKLPLGERIDFVSVTTPNASHYDICKTFLEHGIHVVCDKPMTYNLEQAQKLVKLVNKTKLVFALTHNYTGYPMVRQARELFASGKMGTVRKVLAEYIQDWLMSPLEGLGQKQASWRTDPRQSGIAGAVGDIGTHAFNLVEYITGDRVASLCADFTTFVPGRKLEDDANMLLRFAGGGKGVLTASQISCGEENGLTVRIFGTKGAIGWKQENPNYLDVRYYGQPRQVHTRGAAFVGKEAAGATRIPAGHPEGYLEGFANIYCGAMEAIRRHLDGKPLKVKNYNFPTADDGLRGMQFIYKSVESSKKGAVWVKV